jgi:hypothetical protein
MVNDPNERVDERLRATFAVDDGAATRLANRALTGPRRNMRRRVSLAFAAVALCAGFAAWLSSPTTVAPPAARQTPAVTELSGSFVDGVLVVSIPGDGVVIAAPEPRDDRPRNGSGIVVVEGDIR